jgi:hypothetical protein
MPVVGKGPFGGFKNVAVSVNEEGKIIMDRFGSFIKPDEAEKIGLALIKASAVAKELEK